jgi:hypothetical protein
MATYTNTVRHANIVTSTGGTPWADGDTVILNQGFDEYTAGLSMPSIDLALLHITGGFRGDITTALNLEAALIKIEGGNQIIRLTSTAPGAFDEMWINTASGATVECVSCTVTLLRQNNSVFLAADSCTVTTFYQTGGQARYDEGGTAITTGNGHGGTTYLNRDIGTLNSYQGHRTIVNSSTCTPTTINLNGGEFVVEGLCGDIGTINGNSGVLDFSRLANSITVSTRAFGPGLLYKPPRAGVTVTFTATNDVAGGPRYS